MKAARRIRPDVWRKNSLLTCWTAWVCHEAGRPRYVVAMILMEVCQEIDVLNAVICKNVFSAMFAFTC